MSSTGDVGVASESAIGIVMHGAQAQQERFGEPIGCQAKCSTGLNVAWLLVV